MHKRKKIDYICKNTYTTMKRILFLIIAIFAFVSCKKDDVKRINFDTNAKIHIKEAKGLRAEETAQTLTWAEILRMPVVRFGSIDVGEDQHGYMRIEHYIDLEKNEIVLPSDLAVQAKSNGTYEVSKGFLSARDMIITIKRDATDKEQEIVAYIPNAGRAELIAKIEQLFKEGNSEEIYRIFREYFKARRCTEAEYKELKEKGLN